MVGGGFTGRVGGFTVRGGGFTGRVGGFTVRGGWFRARPPSEHTGLRHRPRASYHFWSRVTTARCLDACWRDKRMEDRRLKELRTFLDGVQ
eukprot:8064724-Pyramimonas_sp.AAC.1